MCKSQAKSFFSKPHLPLSSWAQAFWPSSCPQSLGSLIHLSIKFFSTKGTLCPVPLKWPLFSVPLPSPPNLWPKMLTQIYHQILHGGQALFNLLYESYTKMLNDKPYTQNVEELPQSYLCTRMCTIRVNERSGAWDVLLVTRWKKVAITSSKHPVSLQKL